jgi:hypothetical protein
VVDVEIFFLAAGPRQLSHSRVRVSRDSWPYFTVSHSNSSNLEDQVPVFIPPGTGFLSPRLLRLAGLRRK